MNDEAKKILPKQRLDIVKYEADIPYGTAGKTLDRMNAKNVSLPEDNPLFDKPLRYTIFNTDLKTFLRGQGEGARIEADIEEKPRPDSEYGPDRTIVQVYQDGKPVSQKKGGGGGQYRRSLEDDLALEAVKRRSIEGQTAVAQVGAFLTSGHEIDDETLGITPEDWKRILGKYWKAVEKGLDNYLTDPPKAPARASKPDQRPQDKKKTADKPPPDRKDAEPEEEPIKHVGDLLTRAGKLDPAVSRADLLEALSVGDPQEIKDLQAAWKMALEISASRRKSSTESGPAEKAPDEDTEKAWEKLNREGA